MKVEQTILPGVVIIKPDVFGDARGFFIETFRTTRYEEAGITAAFVQDNHSRSARGVLRGMHFQKKHPQGKLLTVSHGKVFDVAADINPASPTFGKHVSIELSDENHFQIYIPPGYAHGFCVLSEFADFHYKCTDFYVGNDQHGVMWNDSTLAIDWPIKNPSLSEQDKKWPTLKELI
jgi:dTDP-4-dehydrorhamnose 3,5-epimerase